MLYLIQKNTFRPANFEALMDGLNKLGYEYQIVQSLPFTDNIFEEDGETPFVTPRKDVFPFGAVKLARISKACDWKPGSLLNENHDYNYYKEFYQDNLLNWDSKVVRFEDVEFDHFEQPRFIRPCADSKVFTGCIFTRDEWIEFHENSMINGHTTALNNDTLVQVASPKTIYREVRCWIIDGKVITSARYQGVDLGPYEYDAEKFAQEMANIHCIAEAFVMDVCLTSDGWKIVELNCINCSGFYGADVKLILFELNKHFSYGERNSN